MPIVKVQSSNPRYGAPRPPTPVTQRSLSHAKLQQIRSIFLLADTDRDDKLTWDEVVHAGRLLGVRLVKKESEYEHVPEDTHLYTSDEFADILATALYRDHNAVNEMEFLAKRVFTAIDKHKTGHVSAKDLAAFFAVCGDKKPQEYAEAMMAAIDVSMEEKSITERDLEAFLNACASTLKSKAHKTVPMPEKPFSLYSDITTQLLIRSMMSVEERLEAAESEDSDDGWSSEDEAGGSGPDKGIPEQASEEVEGSAQAPEDDDEDDDSASSKSSQWSTSDDASSDSGGSVASSTMITRMMVEEESSHMTLSTDPGDPSDPSTLAPEHSSGSFARQASLGGTMQVFIEVKGAGHEHHDEHDEGAGTHGALDAHGGGGGGARGGGDGITETGIVPSTAEEKNPA